MSDPTAAIETKVDALVDVYAAEPNPPLAVWQAVVGRDVGAADEAAVLDRMAVAHLIRQAVIRRWTWAVPSPLALATIATAAGDRDVVEIGAGTGFWALLLAARGVAVTAYDATPPPRPFVPVEVGGPEAAARHADDVLLLVWPPHRSPMAADAVRAHRDAGGDTVVTVGETRGGWTGDDDLFDVLDADYDEAQRVDLPRWPGFDDALVVFTRRVTG